MQLNRLSAAEQIYRKLLARNPDNKAYYAQLEAALCLKTEEQRLDFYRRLSTEYKRAIPPRRLPLNFVTGRAFETLVDEYLRRSLTKGVPPLFLDLKPLYADAEKAKTIERLVLGYVESLKKNGTYDQSG
jgi:peptide alpha-N-acetyltransferase